jgi:hypothetical protein
MADFFSACFRAVSQSFARIGWFSLFSGLMTAHSGYDMYCMIATGGWIV